MLVEFWFDPACPFCWLTSRWINDVAKERELEIDWRPISLLFKNDTQPDSPFYSRVKHSRDLLRVVESVRAAGGGERIGALYTEFGIKLHNEQNFDFDVAEVLTGLGLDASHAAAMDDESFDDAIHASMADGLGLTGDDVGTPIIAVTGRAGRVGLFGPVITQLPDDEDRLKLWDGFLAMADVNGFFELKRTRSEMPAVPPVERIR